MLNLNVNFNATSTTETLDPNTLYDALILGAGPAGITAAIYLKRKGLKVAIIATKIGGQVADTSTVENYTGFESITGEGLVHEFQKHLNSLSVPILEGYAIEKVEDGAVKKVTVDNEITYQAKTLLIVTGSKSRKLDVKGETEFYGRGVTYCAICDGPLFTDRRVVVAGGGNSAVEAALDLSKIAEHVTIVHRSQFRADQILLDKLNQATNVTIHLESQIQEIFGEKIVKGISALDKKTQLEFIVEANGVFVEVGYIPNSQLFTDLVETNDKGDILVNILCETSCPGIFAAGDVTNVPYKQIIIAAGEGSKAALAMSDYLNRG